MADRAEKTELGIEQVLERLEELEKRVASLEKRGTEAAAERVGRSEDRPLQEPQEGGIQPPLQTQEPTRKDGVWGTQEESSQLSLDSSQFQKRETQEPTRKGGVWGTQEEKTQEKTEEKKPGATSVVPVLGKAVLAMAGAYLLRAIAESGAAPRWILLVAAIAYAGVWLVLAARAHAKSRFASLVYGLTVAFILAPLLWEGTVRFGALTAGFAAAVLVAYVVVSLGLSWKEELEAIPRIAVVAAVGTAATLMVATHELRALTIGLLVMALATEAAAWSGRWLGLRAVTAAGADFALGVVALVMTTSGGAPAEYKAMSAGEVNAYCLALLGIYGVSMGVRGFALQKRWTILEVTQAAVAFALGTWVSLRATAGGSAGALGAMFLVLAGVCYWGAMRRFAGGSGETNDVGIKASAAGRKWNRRVSANYAAGLVLAGSFLLLGGNVQVLLLSLAAVAAVVVFTRTGYLSLGIHGTFYLVAAGTVCGLFGYAGRALAGTVPTWPEWSFWVVALTGLVIHLVGTRASGEGWRARVLWVLPAAVVGFAVAAVVVAGIAGLGAGELSASRVSMVRTVVTCVMALGLGYAGSRWNRVELGWVAYGAIGLGALKLVLEDLRFGNAGTLMVSLLFYGLVLILLPRVTRFGRVEV